MRRSRRTVLAVASEWDSRHGGLSTFNRELCAALSGAGHAVVCLVPTCSESEVMDAARRGVVLTEARPDPSLSDEMRLCAINTLPNNRLPDIVIGHGRVTGPVAKILAGRLGAHRVHFIHVAPGAIEWFKEHSDATRLAEEREQLEVALAREATLVAAVGPLLTREFSTLLGRPRVHVHQFNPGVEESSVSTEIPAGLQCLLVARAEDELLKGLDIAARAFGLLPKLAPTDRPTGTLFPNAREGIGCIRGEPDEGSSRPRIPCPSGSEVRRGCEEARDPEEEGVKDSGESLPEHDDDRRTPRAEPGLVEEPPGESARALRGEAGTRSGPLHARGAPPCSHARGRSDRCEHLGAGRGRGGGLI